MLALSSGNCLALAPIAEQLKIPTIGWNCDTHQLLLGGKHQYYARPNGNTVSEFIAYALYLLDKKPDVSRVAIIDPDYAFGHDAAAIFKAALKALKPDVEIVAELYPHLGAPTYQTEVSRRAAARPDVIFSNLWGGDLENFRPAGVVARPVQRSPGHPGAGRNGAANGVPQPDGVIIGVLGDGWWMSPDARANPQTVKFAQAYHDKFGEYPVFPSLKMANTFLIVKAAYEAPLPRLAANGRAASRLPMLSEGLKTQTLTGNVEMRSDNEGIVDQLVGVTQKSPDNSFPRYGRNDPLSRERA